MAGRGQAIWLPKSGVLVCLKPGEDITDNEIEALEEFFLMVKEARDASSASSRDRD